LEENQSEQEGEEQMGALLGWILDEVSLCNRMGGMESSQLNVLYLVVVADSG